MARQRTCDLSATSSNKNAALRSVPTFGHCSIDETYKANMHDGFLSLPPSACAPAASPKSPSELSSHGHCLRRRPRRASDSRFSGGLSTVPSRLNEDAARVSLGQVIVLARRFATGLVARAWDLFFYQLRTKRNSTTPSSIRAYNCRLTGHNNPCTQSHCPRVPNYIPCSL